MYISFSSDDDDHHHDHDDDDVVDVVDDDVVDDDVVDDDVVGVVDVVTSLHPKFGKFSQEFSQRLE